MDPLIEQAGYGIITLHIKGTRYIIFMSVPRLSPHTRKEISQMFDKGNTTTKF